MLDTGMPWDFVNSIVSDQNLWRSHKQVDPENRYLAVFQRWSQWRIYSADQLAIDIHSKTTKIEWMTIFDLDLLRQDVTHRARAAVLRVVSDEVKRSSHVFASSGPYMLTPDQAADRRARIEELAMEIRALSAKAEQGGASYQEFEIILRKLHEAGKMPDASSVYAVADAFAN